MIDLSTVKHIHFIGIGGVSNSAIAQILAKKGFLISGSDQTASTFTKELEALGITIFIGHDKNNVQDAELIVYTSAVSDDNPELLAAQALGLPTLSRAEMLGQLMLGYKNSIAIAGTHGKTTTTSMVTRIFNDAKYDPTALVGGYFEDLKSNVRIGASDLFITEACEYKENFLSFYPKIGVVLNIDEDHLDYFNDLDHIVNAFVKFAANIEEDGILVLNGDDYNAKKIIPYYKGRIATFGLSDSCDFIAKNITYNQKGCATFDIYIKETLLCRLNLSVPGLHNIYNALGAFATAAQITEDYNWISEKLENFKNAGRRFETVGELNGCPVIDDYAHHPNEIKATLDAAARIENHGRIICIFQPHTYSRTKELLHGFSSAFNLADEIIVTDIYAAREIDKGEIHARDLVTELVAENKKSLYMSDFEAIAAYIKEHASSGDLIITMGAGTITELSKMLTK